MHRLWRLTLPSLALSGDAWALLPGPQTDRVKRLTLLSRVEVDVQALLEEVVVSRLKTP